MLGIPRCSCLQEIWLLETFRNIKGHLNPQEWYSVWVLTEGFRYSFSKIFFPYQIEVPQKPLLSPHWYNFKMPHTKHSNIINWCAVLIFMLQIWLKTGVYQWNAEIALNMGKWMSIIADGFFLLSRSLDYSFIDLNYGKSRTRSIY